MNHGKNDEARSGGRPKMGHVRVALKTEKFQDHPKLTWKFLLLPNRGLTYYTLNVTPSIHSFHPVAAYSESLATDVRGAAARRS